MSTSTLKAPKVSKENELLGSFLGEVFAFNNSLKLYHWHVTGVGSYAQHIALDQAVGDLVGLTDRWVETTYALKGDLAIVIPETKNPSNIIEHAEKFYTYVEKQRELFTEAFTQSIIDDYVEAIQQLLYRLKRLQ